jgi:hypothetical protein
VVVLARVIDRDSPINLYFELGISLKRENKKDKGNCAERILDDEIRSGFLIHDQSILSVEY